MTRYAKIAIFSALLSTGCSKSAMVDNTASGPGHVIISASNEATEAFQNGVANDWSSLDEAVGKYPTDTRLFETSVIAPELKRLLGPKLAVFNVNTETSSPLQREGDVLYLSGNKAHQGGSNAAYLLVEQKTKALEVGLWENGKFTTYKTPGATITKPKDIVMLKSNADGVAN